MATGWGLKFVIIFLMVDVMLFTYGLSDPLLSTNYANIVPTDENSTFYGVISTNNTTVSDLGLSTELNGSVVSGTPGVTGFWNTLSLVWIGIRTLATFTFAPVFYLTTVGAPLPIILILGLIPSIAFIIALISFVRGKDF